MLSSRLYENYGVTRVRVVVAVLACIALVLLLSPAAAKTRVMGLFPADANHSDDDDAVHKSSDSEYEQPSKHDDKTSSKAVADELVQALLERIGKGRGPIIEGGIGDSGTRGVRDVLKHLGAVMVDEQHVVHNSKDSLIYMQGYDVRAGKKKPFHKRANHPQTSKIDDQLARQARDPRSCWSVQFAHSHDKDSQLQCVDASV